MQMTVELMRRGAVMLKEPCPVCNGVQVRYHGKTYCTNHDDLTGILSATEMTYADASASLRELLLVKLRDAMSLLEAERDVGNQDALVTLLLKYVELLGKLPAST